jgi:hypothetical protein
VWRPLADDFRFRRQAAMNYAVPSRDEDAAGSGIRAVDACP